MLKVTQPNRLHHAVIRSDTKLRVVYDASAKVDECSSFGYIFAL